MFPNQSALIVQLIFEKQKIVNVKHTCILLLITFQIEHFLSCEIIL